jgi:hypothetical protein
MIGRIADFKRQITLEAILESRRTRMRAAERRTKNAPKTSSKKVLDQLSKEDILKLLSQLKEKN